MVNIYCDTSLLFSLFAKDVNSPRVDDWRKANPAPLFFTQFQKLELKNSLSLAIFQNRLTVSQVQAIWQDVERDLNAGFLDLIDLDWRAIWLEAEGISAKNTALLGTRTLDVIHVAICKHLQAQEFFTCDKRQQALAKHIGLTSSLI